MITRKKINKCPSKTLIGLARTVRKLLPTNVGVEVGFDDPRLNIHTFYWTPYQIYSARILSDSGTHLIDEKSLSIWSNL